MHLNYEISAMAKQTAKTSSKNIPSQRQKREVKLYNGKEVVVMIHYDDQGRTSCVAAYKDDVISCKDVDVFVRNANGERLLWSEVPR